MPPQIKQDLNRSGWESTDFPSVCESCLPPTQYVQMLKEDHGLECKICTRPYTVFRWKSNRTARQSATTICLTCARLKNCCQSCMLDLSFGLPIVIRDAALKMVAPGPQSAVNREFFAQNNEREIEEGRGGTEEYEKADQKGRELLRKLANSQPYFRKQRQIQGLEDEDGEGGEGSSTALVKGGTGPIRTQDSRRGAMAGRGRGGASGRGRAFPSAATLPPREEDIRPPQDPTITSLFITGIEDDLPEHKIRDHFSPYGKLRSLVCSHMSHCAFINYFDRQSAEAAAEACQGRAIISGCPLRVQWGKPRPIGTMDKDERAGLAREGRSAYVDAGRVGRGGAVGGTQQRPAPVVDPNEDLARMSAVAAPPGGDEVNYASLAGN